MNRNRRTLACNWETKRKRRRRLGQLEELDVGSAALRGTAARFPWLFFLPVTRRLTPLRMLLTGARLSRPYPPRLLLIADLKEIRRVHCFTVQRERERDWPTRWRSIVKRLSRESWRSNSDARLETRLFFPISDGDEVATRRVSLRAELAWQISRGPFASASGRGVAIDSLAQRWFSLHDRSRIIALTDGRSVISRGRSLLARSR